MPPPPGSQLSRPPDVGGHVFNEAACGPGFCPAPTSRAAESYVPLAHGAGAEIGDDGVVTHYWYRFTDQPAMLNADLTDGERGAVQARVEQLHRAWKKERDYLPPPATGRLADIDPALIVTPPPGLEVGYVPIATRQAAKE